MNPSLSSPGFSSSSSSAYRFLLWGRKCTSTVPCTPCVRLPLPIRYTFFVFGLTFVVIGALGWSSVPPQPECWPRPPNGHPVPSRSHHSGCVFHPPGHTARQFSWSDGCMERSSARDLNGKFVPFVLLSQVNMCFTFPALEAPISPSGPKYK